MPKKRLPSKGRDLTEEEKIELARQVCELYATDKYTIDVCLGQVGIKARSTWYAWVNEIEQINQLYIKAQETKKDNYNASLVERAKTSLERYLEGFTIKTEEQEAIPGRKPGDMIITKAKVKEVYIRPSVRLIEFVLVNLDGKTFTRNPEPYKAGNESIPNKIEIKIIGGKKAPIRKEDDITDIDTEEYLRDYPSV